MTITLRVGHLHSNGKMERFHKIFKSECVRTQALGGFEETKKIIKGHVHEYNHEWLHSDLNYQIPSDYLKGEEYIKQRLEGRKTTLEQARQDRRQKQNQLRQVVGLA